MPREFLTLIRNVSLNKRLRTKERGLLWLRQSHYQIRSLAQRLLSSMTQVSWFLRTQCSHYTHTSIVYSDVVPSVISSKVGSLHTPTFKGILSISGGVLKTIYSRDIPQAWGICSPSEVPWAFVLKCKGTLRISLPGGKQ